MGKRIVLTFGLIFFCLIILNMFNLTYSGSGTAFADTDDRIPITLQILPVTVIYGYTPDVELKVEPSSD